jgi:hypothetical protein
MRPSHLLALGIWIGISAVDCASVTPPRDNVSAVEHGFDCRPLRGSERGLTLRIDIPGGLRLTDWVLVNKDGEQLLRFSIADLESGPQRLAIGDGGVEAGQQYRYVCGVFRGSRLLARAEVEVSAIEPPSSPPSPEVRPDPRGTVVSWDLPDGTWAQVLRRDVLAGDEPVPVSPVLAQPSWIDRSTTPGQLYAYSLRAVVYERLVPWESEPGPERYIDMPAAAAP